ncbi:hypothetical protein C1I89_31865 [Achromobacter pulmonis]|uniref:Spore protein YkvP/CgeB glycosyl transferase-like domain-containing protein n=2 Tax=Achromobacter pulmonis TaxID=1389932 RepID=A0A2N8K950_9BURK|nr:hypothetical protein C1I89_31865 [Achromobacter pulmonis]
MERILDSIQDEGFELDIYDRYHGDTDPLHVWPEKYQTYLRPAKPHDQMPAVYKSSRFGLNINTVTNSPTMFARRVFELMSCNTLVLSNHALGTERMFGDLIVYPERERGRLRSLTSSEVEDLRARALAKVLSEHTYRHRWNAVLQNIGVPHRPRQETITVVAMVHQQDDALAALAWFQQFGGRLPGGRLLLVAGREMEGLAVADIYRRFNRFGVTVTSASHATRYAMLDRYKPVETTHFLVLDLKAPPSAQWLAHARLHLQYWTGYPIAPSQDQSQQYRFGRVAPQSTLIDRQCAFGNWLEEYSNSRNVYFV